MKGGNQDEDMFKDLPLNGESRGYEHANLNADFMDNIYWKITPSQNDLDRMLTEEGLE